MYKAEHLVMNRLVALKILPKSILNDKEKEARFLNEVHSIASLNHPIIIKGFAAGVSDEGYPFIATEFFPGRNLAEILQQDKHLSPQRLVEIMVPVTEALSYAHQHHIIHRDLKPSNIMVDDAGNVVLIDFGIAKILADTNADEPGLKLTKTGAIIGSTKYISPEQIKGQAISEATDVYSLGVVLFECLSGHVPFKGSTDAQVIYSHVHDPVPKLRIAQPESYQPQAIEELVKTCLQKDPSQRFQSMSTLRKALIETLDKHVPLLRKETMLASLIALLILLLISMRIAADFMTNRKNGTKSQLKGSSIQRLATVKDKFRTPKEMLKFLKNKRDKLDRRSSLSKLADWEQLLNQYDKVVQDLEKTGEDKERFYAYFARAMTEKKRTSLLRDQHADISVLNKSYANAIEDLKTAESLAAHHTAEELVATKELADSYDTSNPDNKDLAKENFLRAIYLQGQLQHEATAHADGTNEESNFEDSGTKEIWILKRLAEIFRAQKDYKNASKYYAEIYERTIGEGQPTQFGVFPRIAGYIDFLLENHEQNKAKQTLERMERLLKKDGDPKDQGCDSLEIALLEHKSKNDKLAKFYLQRCKQWCAQNKEDPDSINKAEKIKNLEKELYPASSH